MLYLNSRDISTLGHEWGNLTETIAETIRTLDRGEFSQPIKPFVRFNDMTNRIIAMPAYVGGQISMAGIKWIASFPGNLERGIPRAHSVTILNDPSNGEPVMVCNSALISGIRTASVSALVMSEFIKVKQPEKITVGVIGLGPIGQLHIKMVTELLGDMVDRILVFDRRPVFDDLRFSHDQVINCPTLQDVYNHSDIFITCTTSSQGYINLPPQPNSLILNVSLRDFCPSILDYTQSIIVDDWDEVCRENTDIEKMSVERGLQKSNTKSLADVVCREAMKYFPKGQAIMVNPMGMSSFDVAIATYYYNEALVRNIGTVLPD